MTRLRVLLIPAAVGLALAAVPPPPAGAELYRCEGPDGRTVYTDSAATCPGARTHEPRATLQTVPSQGVPAPAARPPAALEAQAEESRKAEWRWRKQEKEQELHRLEQRTSELERFVTACNRGGEVIQKDAHGLKRKVSCDELLVRFAELEQRRESVRAYLTEGIYEECRRAGCLPGWLR